MSIIDLRSDTVTRPTEEMRIAMAAAEVGDDVFLDDPTVIQLESRFAEMTGKDAALFVPTGTMGNQIAIRVHARQAGGDEVICDVNSHIMNYEGGGAAAISGLSLRPLTGERGVFTADQVAAAIAPDDVHWARTSTVVIENTHNRGGGNVWPIESVAAVSQLARKHNLRMHLDGARIWNAAIAKGNSLSDWCSHFDSLTACLSKGLGCPIGSILAGSNDFIREARRVRKMIGGGMRQVGVLAAAGLYAFDHHISRLAEDHANARTFGQSLNNTGLFKIEPPETNMLYFRLAGDAASGSPIDFVAGCRNFGVWFNHTGGGRFRTVFHLDVPADKIAETAVTVARVAAELTPASPSKTVPAQAY